MYFFFREICGVVPVPLVIFANAFKNFTCYLSVSSRSCEEDTTVVQYLKFRFRDTVFSRPPVETLSGGSDTAVQYLK